MSEREVLRARLHAVSLHLERDVFEMIEALERERDRWKSAENEREGECEKLERERDEARDLYRETEERLSRAMSERDALSAEVERLRKQYECPLGHPLADPTWGWHRGDILGNGMEALECGKAKESERE